MLLKDRNTYESIQTFCPVNGKCNIEPSATKHTGNLIRCAEDGDVTFTWADADGSDTDTISMVAGDDYAIRRATVTIVSGKFHIS